MLYYISYGKQTFRRKEGLAADFCPICRRAVGVEVQQMRSQNHVYHIGIGQGDLVGRLCHCLDCHSEWALQPGTIQTLTNPTTRVSLETLLSETYPQFANQNAARLAVEAAILRDPHSLDAATRQSLISEPFFVLDNDVAKESKTSGGFANFAIGLGCLVSIVFAIVALVAFLSQGLLVGFLSLVATVGIIWGILKLSAWSSRKFMREKIYPRLASCLAPLDPSADELTRIVGQLNSTSAKRTKLPDFLPMLAEARTRVRVAQPVGDR